MSKPHFLPKLAITGIVAGAAMMAAPLKADAAVLIIDDWNGAGANSSEVTDETADLDSAYNGNTGVSGPTIIDPANTIMNGLGWTREIYAELDFGNVIDDVSTEVCYFCDAGHLVSGGGPAEGWSAFRYFGGPMVDLSAYNAFMFDYAADLDGGNVFLYTDKNNDGVFNDLLASSVTLFPLGLSNTNNSADITNPANRTSVSISLLDKPIVDDLEIRVEGVQNLELTIDNAKLTVPEPGSILGLIVASGLGLGLKRKKDQA